MRAERREEATIAVASFDGLVGPEPSLGYRIAKRTLDLVIAVASLPVVIPLLLAFCLAISSTSRGWPIYRQWRVGYRGRPFKIWKLRTMVKGADQIGPELTQNADPRVTKVGAWLRRWSLDELPQVFNIVAGQMSFVGPRPELPTIVTTYSEEQREVLMVRPGLTGPSQVNGRDDLGIEEKLAIDRSYVYSCSLWRDIAILLKTPMTVISGRGVRY